MVDALALGASAVRHEGSSPFPGTKNNERNVKRCVIYFLPRKGLELSPKRSQFCNQNCEDEAGVEATCRDEKCNHFEASRSGDQVLPSGRSFRKDLNTRLVNRAVRRCRETTSSKAD